jgi:cold shock protein
VPPVDRIQFISRWCLVWEMMEGDGAATEIAWHVARSAIRWDDHSRRQMATGKIRTLRVDKGFGFIKDDSGKDYFFHQSAVYGEGLENLREGDSVEFEVGEGPKGPRAENVRRTST